MTPKGVFADKKRLFELVPERGITFSRLDASNLAQAKAANFCGQVHRLANLGLKSGRRATALSRRWLCQLRRCPSRHRHRLFGPRAYSAASPKVGNAAAQGAREVLLSAGKRARIEALAKRIEHVELETTPDFFELFVEGCQFKPMPRKLTAASV